MKKGGLCDMQKYLSVVRRRCAITRAMEGTTAGGDGTGRACDVATRQHTAKPTLFESRPRELSTNRIEC